MVDAEDVFEPIEYNYSGPQFMSPFQKVAMKIYKKASECGVPRQFLRDLTHILNADLLSNFDAETCDR